MAFKSSITPNISVSATPQQITPVVPVGNTLTVIGLSLASTVAVTTTVSAILVKGAQQAFLIKNATLLPGGTLVIVGGDQKIVLEAGDQVLAYASATNSVDASISYLTTVISGPTTLNATDTVTYNYTGTLDAPPIVFHPLTAIPASPTGKERTGLIVVPTTNIRLTSIEFPYLEQLSGTSTGAAVFSQITISGCSNLTQIGFPQLTRAGGNISISANPQLTTLNLPVLSRAISSITVSSNNSLATLNLPELQFLGGSFGVNTLNQLTSLNAPKLEIVNGQLSISTLTQLTSMSFPALTIIGGAFAPGTMSSLTSMSFPALTTIVSSFAPGTMSSLTSMSFPALTIIGGALNPFAMGALTQISMPQLISIGHALTSGAVITINSGTAALTTFTLPATLKQVGNAGAGVLITSAALDQASVDNILVRLAALDGTNGTVSFDSRTVTITGTSATPSATGLAAKAVLQARGCTVTHN